MTVRIGVVCFALAFALSLRAQTGVRQISALARRGLHHSDVLGRFVDLNGKPVRGVRVQIGGDWGRDRLLPLIRTESNEDGRFEFLDVNTSETPLVVRWYPSDKWLQGDLRVQGESFDRIDLGTIHLEVNTIIRATVETEDGKPLGAKNDVWIVLRGRTNVVAGAHGKYWVLQQIPFEEVQCEISVTEGGRHELFKGEYVVQHGRRDQLLRFRLLRSTLKPVETWFEGQFQISEERLPPASLESSFLASGRMIAPHGSPVRGAVVVGRSDYDEPSWLTTDASGRFEFRYQAERCSGLPECGTARDIRLTDATKLVIKPMGVNLSDAQAYSLYEPIGWQPFFGMESWIDLRSAQGVVTVKVDAPGYLPVVRKVPVPAAEYLRKGKKPPDHVEATFRFDSDTLRDLQVVAAGKPVRDAIVDLEWVGDLDSADTTMLSSYRTGPDGRLRLLGGADELIEAFVYSSGYEPLRVVWESGRPLRVELAHLNARFSFTTLCPSCRARVFRVDQPEFGQTVRGRDGLPPELAVRAGQYDIVSYSNADEPAGYERVTVTPGQLLAADSDLDQRPTLIVRFSQDGWSSYIYETLQGDPLNWTLGGLLLDQSAVTDHESKREMVYRLSRGGRAYIEAHSATSGYLLWREVMTNPGDVVTVDVPSGDAVLQASMGNHGGGLFEWTPPRMELIADDPANWSVRVYPQRDSGPMTTLRNLPAGSYHLYRHLIGAVKNNNPVPYRPICVWGGIPVELRGGQSTRIADTVDYPFPALTVTVQDQAGHEVDGGTLRVRDRVSEWWHRSVYGSANNADYPIPYPPAVRLRHGRATLPSIRAGQLEVRVEVDDGSVYSFVVDADPARPLVLRVPRTNIP
jgi:hypothetical protein